MKCTVHQSDSFFECLLLNLLVKRHVDFNIDPALGAGARGQVFPKLLGGVGVGRLGRRGVAGCGWGVYSYMITRFPQVSKKCKNNEINNLTNPLRFSRPRPSSPPSPKEIMYQERRSTRLLLYSLLLKSIFFLNKDPSKQIGGTY